jgi:hypothetical protein
MPKLILVQKITWFALISVVCACNSTKRINQLFNNENVIETNRTTVKSALGILGNYDDNFETVADGISSNGAGAGHTSTWFTFKKYGIAIHTVIHYPQNDSLDGLVQIVRIFDTTTLSNKRGNSIQIQRYYDEDYYMIRQETLNTVFGNPDKIKTLNSLIYFFYRKNSLVFVFDKQNKSFMKMYILK